MVINLTPINNGLIEFQKKLTNCYFSIYHIPEYPSIRITLAFDVEGNVWKHSEEVSRRELIIGNNNISIITKNCAKLLAAKRTTQLCVKFWTGVEIC